MKARIINSECTNIDEAEEFTIYEDGKTVDLGYPSAIELGNGNILVVYYCHDNDDDICYIKGTVIRNMALMS